MQFYKNKHLIILSVCLLLTILIGCEYKNPAVIYDKDQQPTDPPAITSVGTGNSAWAGITELKIKGTNFSPVLENNAVYFNSYKALLKSAVPTELLVLPPDVVGDSFTVKVVVTEAEQLAQFGPYKLEKIYKQTGESGEFNAIAVDNEGNIYANVKSTARKIIKITPDGEQTDYGNVTFNKASAMKMGNDGYLYIQKENDKNLYRIAPGGGTVEKYAKAKKNVNYFDFDEYGNIFSGGTRYGLQVINSELTAVDPELYKNSDIRGVRVYNGFVYTTVETDTQTAIWKNQISPDGSLGDPELYFDWIETESLSDTIITINDITFSADGDLYVATDHDDPIIIIGMDGSVSVLYEGVLDSPIKNFIWGNSYFLYVNYLDNSNPRVERITMDSNLDPSNIGEILSAPYFLP